jgi:hypothetical protein
LFVVNKDDFWYIISIILYFVIVVCILCLQNYFISYTPSDKLIFIGFLVVWFCLPYIYGKELIDAKHKEESEIKDKI